MRKGDKGKKVFGVFVILAIFVSVFGGVVSAEAVSVDLTESFADVILTLYVHECSASGPVLSGAQVTGQNGAGNSFDKTSGSTGDVTVTGTPGSWQFTASKSGYKPVEWDQSITSTCERDAYFSEKAHYNSQAAVNYAINYAYKACGCGGYYGSSPPPQGSGTPLGSNGDCAHFVSHCLAAGGLSNKGTAYATGWCEGGAHDYIINVSKMREWFTNTGIAIKVSSVSQLEPGDVIVTNNYGHVVLYIGTYGGNTNQVASHSAWGIFSYTYFGTPNEYWHISTSSVQKPTVETRDASAIMTTAAFINGRILDDGGSTIIERRFDWGTTPACEDDWTADVTVVGNNFFYFLTGLTPSTTYYFRAGAKNRAGWGWGNVLSFTTSAECPTPGTPSNQSPSNHAAGVSINTNLDWSDCSNTDFYDVYFGTSSPPPPHGSAPTSTTPCYPFQNDLEYGTKYYWKIEAKNNCGGNTSGLIWDFNTEEAPNQPPTAIIDPITPDSAEQGTDTVSVSFSGHGTDTDGTVVAYNWSSSIDGPLSTSASFTKPASELSVGTHTFYFNVQDNDGAWSTEDTADLTIYPANVPPTAIIDSITPDPAVQGTDTVSFTGHGTDTNGTVVAYNWSSSIDGPLSTSAAFTKPASELLVGTHTFYFNVQDNDGAWSTEDTEDLTIYPANVPPTAIIDSITPDPAEQGTDTVSFTGHGTDPDGTVVAYNWSSSIDGPLSTSAASTKPASELSVGTHTIYFNVQDDDGTWSTEDTADLTIYPANVPPTAIIDSITPDPAEQGTDTVSFTGHGTDPDGTVAAYNWSSSIDGPLNTSAAFTKPASELSVGTHTIYFNVQDDDGTWSSEDTADLTIYPGPELSYSPESHDFGDMREGETDNTTFEIWNSGTDTLTYSLSETCDWLEVHPTSGSSTGEHNSITVDMDTTGLFEGSHTCDIKINSNDGSGTFTVMVNVVPCPCGNMSVNLTSWSTTLNCSEPDNEIVTVSATGGTVKGVTVSKVSGPTWFSVSQTDLGDIASGSNKTFTMTAAPPSEASGDFTYTVTVSNTCGTPSTMDVSGTINVSCPCGNKGVYPTSWSPTLNCGESDSQIVTVSASDCIVNGVTVSKVSGPTWLSVSQTDLGDIASGSSETFTVTAAPPAGTSSGDYPYTIRVSNTCGTPSTRDVSGTINVNENAEGQTDYWAVIVGVADYTGTLYDLAYTDDDAIDMYNTLLLSDHWQADHIMLLLDSEADRAGILAAFNWLDDNEDPDDVVLFFFSGHGTYGPDDDGDESDGWDEFICPCDFNNIRDDELDAELDRLESTSIAVLIDSCFAGGMTKAPDRSVKTISKQKVELTDGFAKDIQDEKKDVGDSGRVVLMACDDDEYSYEIPLLENGLFSYYVIEALQGCADAEGNGDDICSAEETFVYAEPRVVAIISTQNPQLYDGYTGELPITRPPCPELSYSPASHNFGDMCEGVTDSTTFELWNSGTGTLTYSLSETCDWLEVHPTGGSSTGVHYTITVDIDTTGLAEGPHTCDISISSNGGSGTFTVTVNIVAPTGSISVTSTPSGATICLDGSYIGGQTPYTNTNVPAGTHTLKLTLGGYYDWSSNVGVTAGETSYVYATLSPIPPQRTITFYTDPTAGGTITFDGSIYSNGQSTTKTDGTYSVSANPASNYEFNHWSTTDGMSVANLYSQSTTATVSGDGTIKAWFDYYIPCPELSYSPASQDFDNKCEGVTDSATFELWNSGTGTLTYSLSESGDWLNVYPISGSSTGEHGTITVDIDTTGLAEGPHTCDITINSNDGTGTFTVTVNVVPYPESSWTFMIYLDGDNDLEYAAIGDFMEMSSVGSSPAVNIVVQFDRIPGYDTSYGDWRDCKRFHVTYGMTPTPASAISDLGECNMGDPNTLDAFVTWAMTNFPADNYALILWNHGDGWKSINDWVPWAADIKDAKDAGLSRGICWDVTNGWDSLTLQETEDALTGKYVQLLGYDACLMHMIEVVYQVKANAGVSVGSEESEPGDGWPYDTILADLTGTPTMNVDALGMLIVDRYMASYPTRNDLTQSAMANLDLPNLVAAVDNLAQALINEINAGNWTQVQQARTAAEEIYYPYYIDLYNFAEMVDTDVPGATAQAQAVMNEVSKIYEAHGTSVPNDHGLSTYYPQGEGDYLPSYDNTAFAIDTEWNEFLKRYYEGPVCEGTATSCGIYPNCENCNNYDGCYAYGDGCEDRDYYCESNEAGCNYTYSNRHNDGWVDTGNTDWVPDPGNDCQEKEQKEQKYRNYYCSGSACTYGETGTQWVDTGTTRNKPDGTICDCTARNTLKRCYSGVCMDTGICDATTCSADAACDGKAPGDSCGGGTCDSNCKCGGQAVGADYGVFRNDGWWEFKYGPVDDIPNFQPADHWLAYGIGAGTPIVGDFNDNDIDDLGIRYNDGWWEFKYGPVDDIPNFQPADHWLAYGIGTGTPIVGDFNDDNIDDLGIRYNDGWWEFKYGPVDDILNCQSADHWLAYGIGTGTPIVGDFNDDNIDDLGIRYNDGWWEFKYGPVDDIPNCQPADHWLAYGIGTGTPIVGDFNDDGIDGIGIRYNDGWWEFKYGPVDDIPNFQPADHWLAYGIGTGTPLVGSFNP